MRKRFLSTLLAICMVLSLLPVTAFADEPAGGNVAKIGTMEYATLAEAIKAAENGSIITLIGDVVLDPTDVKDSESKGLEPVITIDKDLTLDLSGYSITWDCDEISNINISYTPAFFEIQSAVVITGNGTIDAEALYNNSYGINVNGGSLTIENGTFYGAPTAVQVQTGSLMIHDGTFGLAKTISGIVPSYKKYVINAIDASWKNESATILISGGMFPYDYSAYPEGADTTYLAPGYELSKNEDGAYSVQMNENVSVQVLNSNGSITGAYATLQDALTEAQSGDTVMLLEEISTNEAISISKSIILDLNDKTVQSSSRNSVFSISSDDSDDVTVEIENGTIKGNTKGIWCSAGSLTLTNVTVNAEEGYALHMTGAATVIVDQDSVIASAEESGIYIVGNANQTPVLRVYGSITGGKYEGEYFPAIDGTSYDEDDKNEIHPADVYIYSNSVIQSQGDIEAIYYSAPGKLVISGGRISSTSNALYIETTAQSAEISVTGGEFTGDISAPEGIKFISGGYFTSDPSDYLADGYAVIESDKEGYDYTVCATYRAVFDVTPAGAEIEVVDASGSEVAANSDGSYTLNGANTYTYTVSALGYEEQTGTITAGDNAPTQIIVTLNRIYKVTYQNERGEAPAAVTVTAVGDGAAQVMLSTDAMSADGYTFGGWEAPDGETYSAGSVYTITADTEFVAVWTEIPPEAVTYTVTFDSNGGSDVPSITVIDGELLTVPTAPTRGGYDFGGWQYGGVLYQPGQQVTISADAAFVAQWTEQPVVPATMQVDFLVTPETVTAAIVVKDANGRTVTANEYGGYDVLLGETYTYTVSASGYVTKTGTFVPSTAEGGNLVTVTLTKQSSGSSSGGSSSGGSSSSSATTTTTTNPDGSTTTTTTDKNTGTVTETTKNPDGSTTTVITAKDGASTETNATAQGVTGTVVTNKSGAVTSVEAAIPAAVANTGETVTIPVTVTAADSTDKAAVVEIMVKGGGSASVEIPVTDVNPGLVAVVVNSNGTEEIVKTSVVTEDGVVLNVDGSAAVKVVDNTQQFIDVKTSDWFDGAVTFVAAREIMSGTEESMFSPDVDLTRSMMAQVLYSLENKPNAGADVFDDVASRAWYADAVNWAAEKKVVAGYSDGTFGPEDTITREQMAVILYGYARLKGADLRASAKVDAFRDGSRTSEWARGAMEWALTQGLLSGKGGNILDPQGAASRAEVAQVLANFCNLMAK